MKFTWHYKYTWNFKYKLCKYLELQIQVNKIQIFKSEEGQFKNCAGRDFCDCEQSSTMDIKQMVCECSEGCCLAGKWGTLRKERPGEMNWFFFSGHH